MAAIQVTLPVCFLNEGVKIKERVQIKYFALFLVYFHLLYNKSSLRDFELIVLFWKNMTSGWKQRDGVNFTILRLDLSLQFSSPEMP